MSAIRSVYFTSIDSHLQGKGGGMAVYIDEMAKALASLGIKVHIAFPSKQNVEETVNGVCYHGLSVGNKHYYLSRLPQMNGPARIVREREYGKMFLKHLLKVHQETPIDVVEMVESGHTAIARTFISGLKKVIRLHGNQYAFRVHSHEKLSYWDKQEERLLRKSMKEVDGISAPSKYYLDFKAQDSKIIKAIIPNPVRSEFFENIRKPMNETPTFIHVSRFEYCKGIMDVLEAMQKIPEANVRLKIVADPNSSRLDPTDLKRFLNQIESDDRIEMMGFLPKEKLVEELKKCDAFIQASHFESFGIAVYEAMALGLKIISTQGGGLSDHINSDNALLFEAGDSSQLANCINAFLKGENKTRSNSNVAELLKQFRIERILEKELNFFIQLKNG